LCSPLKDMGLFTEVGKRTCSVTNRVVYAWDVTDRKEPLEVKRAVSTSEKLSEQLKIATNALSLISEVDHGDGGYCDDIISDAFEAIRKIDED